MDKLKYSTTMLKLCCITNIIQLIMNEAESIIKGSVHEYSYFIVHNALVLMATKGKNNWMR